MPLASNNAMGIDATVLDQFVRHACLPGAWGRLGGGHQASERWRGSELGAVWGLGAAALSEVSSRQSVGGGVPCMGSKIIRVYI